MTAHDLTTIAPFVAAILLAAAILSSTSSRPAGPCPALVVDVHRAGDHRRAHRHRRRRSPAGVRRRLRVDALTTFLDLLFVSIVALTMLFAPDYLEGRGLPVAEFAAVLVFAMSGAMLIAGSADLLVLFLGLELMVCRATCWRATTRPTATAPRARSSTSSSARSRARSSCSGRGGIHQQLQQH